MDISTETLAIIAVLGPALGAGIAGGSSLITTLINKRSEERKHYRELVMNAAIANWKQFVDLTPPGETIEPLEDFIVHMMRFYDLVLSKKLDKKTLEKRLQEISDQSLGLYEFRTRQVRQKLQN